MGMKAAALYKAAGDMSQYIDSLLSAHRPMQKQATDFTRLPDMGVHFYGGGDDPAGNLSKALSEFYKQYPIGNMVGKKCSSA